MEGMGFGDPLNGGYPAYGSIGNYTLVRLPGSWYGWFMTARMLRNGRKQHKTTAALTHQGILQSSAGL
jgi:hypothetical protein